MSRKILYIIALSFFIPNGVLLAQTEAETEEDHYIEIEYVEELENFYFSDLSEIGLDFTPLISKLIPFNLAENEAQLIGLKYKRYKRTHAFRLNLGASLESSNDQQDDFFYFSLGYEKRKVLTPRWSYVTGYEFVSLFEENSNFFNESFVGASKFFGIEYNISNTVFLSTEGNLAFLFGDGDNKIQFNVPQSIFFSIRF